MKKMYAPWRHEYVTGTRKKDAHNTTECVFCHQFAAHNDEKYYILKRYSHAAVVMNYYPYNVGHLMVIPYQHASALHELEQETRNQLMELITLSTQVLTKVVKTESFNVGINLGKSGGGGIPEHVHAHILPRWSGDTNFLETLAGVKLISTDFFKIYSDLKNAFELV